MITWWRPIQLCFWGVIAAIAMTGIHIAGAQEAGGVTGKKTRVEVQFTESFYNALRAEEGKTYTTDQADEYLRRIAVASRFMVETNLQVIENQKRIITLLESMQKPPSN